MPVEVKTIQQAYRFALRPTPSQTQAFHSHAGAARFAFNWGLATVSANLDARAAAEGDEKPKPLGHFDLCKLWTAHKDDPANELHWVSENSICVYQAALRDAATAWGNFFKSRKGARAGRKMGRPRFKSKRTARRSFQLHGTGLTLADSKHVKLPKIGVVRTSESTRKLLRRLTKGNARIVRGTIAQDSAGRWHIALTAEVQREIRTGPSARQKAGGAIGLDLGARDVVTTSDADVYPNPRHLGKALAKLQRLGRALSRTAKDSGRRERAKRKLGRAHNRVANLRLDATHKMTTALIHTHAAIGVEGWDVAETAQRGSKDVPKQLRRNRNRALADAGLGRARWQLESKAAWYGATVVVTGKQDPTGRTCSACGAARDKPVPPAENEFRCPTCGFVGDRRVNTARVLAKAARTAMTDAPSTGESLNAPRGDVRPAKGGREPNRGGRSPTKGEVRPRRKRREPGGPDP